jgi:hypothetical protein
MIFQVEILEGETVKFRVAQDFSGVPAAREFAEALIRSAEPPLADGFRVLTSTGGIVAVWPDA